MAQSDVTLPDGALDAPTIIETQRATDTMLAEPVARGREIFGVIREFRGWKILESLPTKGSEADIYLTDAGGEKRVLKLYRHRMEPKLEILRRVTEMSRQYSHCFVIFYETGFDETTSRWYELQEYMPLGSLKDVPADAKRSPHFIAQFISELSTAIQCLHDNGIVHCDLKPANVLVRTMEPLDLVLTDFGISSLMANDMSQKMTGLKGTPMYWAPEAFSRVVGRPCDWWAFGMMLFEMLSGAHPFEHLSDSRIIHRLTLGGVEVPEYFGPEWGMLVKGLLTKDDSKRWGKAEVDRWLAGARDIPVYFETPGIGTDGTRPFRFDGADYFTEGDLAAALAESEEPWKMPADYLRFIRTWYESNSRWDEAAAIAEASRGDPGLALFSFVNAHSLCPFAMFGRKIDAEAVYGIIGREIDGETDETEHEILSMINYGRIAPYFEEYARHKRHEDGFPELVKFLSGKKSHEQLAYIGAFLRPDGYVLPRAQAKSRAELVETLRHMETPPLPRSHLDGLAGRFVIPKSLTELFGDESTYAEGAHCLEYLRERELLIPSSLGGAVEEGVSLADYEKAALVYCYGHSHEMLETIDELIGELGTIGRESPRASNAAIILGEMKLRKITDADHGYIEELSELFAHRRELKEKWRGNAAIWGAALIIVCAVARAVLGITGYLRDAEWVIVSLATLMTALVMSAFLIDRLCGIVSARRNFASPRLLAVNDPFRQSRTDSYRGTWAGMIAQIAGMAMGGILLVLYRLPHTSIPAIVRALSLAFPIFGAFLGVGIAYALYHFRMMRSLMEIERSCALLCAAMKGREFWPFYG